MTAVVWNGFFALRGRVPGTWYLPNKVQEDEELKLIAPASKAGSGWRSAMRSRLDMALHPEKWLPGSPTSPVERSLGRSAVAAVEFALEGHDNLSVPFVVPCDDGSVQIEWHNNLVDIEVVFAEEGSIDIWIKDKRTKNEFEASGTDALGALTRWAPALDARRDMGEKRVSPPVEQIRTFA